jgi:hypothetical protein
MSEKTLEECSVLELKGVLFDLLSQQEQVRIMIQKKVQEEAKTIEVAKA